MTQPTTYDRQTSFALFSSENPGEPHSGVDLDTEFNAVKVSLDDTQANLALIQDDDGALARGSVGIAQFDESVTLGVRSQGVWVAAHAYIANVDTVFHTTKIYLCLVSHTSGVFATDLAAAKWLQIADLGVQVLDVNTVGEANLQTDSVSAVKIQAAAVTAPKLATGAVTTAKYADASIMLAKLAAEVANRLVPAGAITGWAWDSVPAGWLHANGQSVLRADYPVLFALIGGYYGAVDGTHFNVPNLMGRQIVGLDGAGGATPTGLVTSAGSGISALSLGATGGTQSKVLTIPQMPTITPAGVIGNVEVPHTHAQATPTVTNGTFTGAGANGWGGTYPNNSTATGSASTGITSTFTGTPFGTNAPHSTMDPSMALPYIIKAH